MRIGILGGTFDPIHYGHLAAGRAAMDCAQLDRVLFVPSAQPPHRSGTVAPAKDRLAMVRLAVEHEDGLAVSDVEIRRGGRSYTLDTLKEFKAIFPSDDLFLILGWDAARLFSTWRQPQEILELASIVVVGRPGTQQPSVEELRAAGLDPVRTVICMEPTPDVSGSELRLAIASEQDVENRVPEAVAGYITKHRLYGDNR